MNACDGGGWTERRHAVLRLAVPLLFALLFAACGGKTPLPGTDLGGTPAADFRLTDQAGREVTLGNLRGKAIALTFMYTSCPDYCPLTAEAMRQAVERLGKDAGKVALVAVSVDPERDDRAAAATFSTAHHMPEENWHYLTGSEQDLAPVWAAYGIGVQPGSAAVAAVPSVAADLRLAHNEALYLIDQQGRERSVITGDIDPAQLAAGLRTLIT